MDTQEFVKQANFFKSLIKNNILNDLYIFKTNKNLNKFGTNNDTSAHIKKSYSKLITINLNGDKLLKINF